MIYKFGNQISTLCCFCMKEPESPIHLHNFFTNQLSLDAATAFFPNCTNNPSYYTRVSSLDSLIIK